MDGKAQRMPSQAEILEMIDGLGDISEEEKENLKREILGSAGGKPSEPVKGDGASPELAVVLLLFLIIAAVIGGIAFVLIKREKRREEEKRKKKKEVQGKGKGKKAAKSK